MTELNTSNIATYYAQMSDNDFNFFVVNNAAGLRPEIMPVVYEEMKRRGMDMHLFKQIENQNRLWTDDELNDYCDLFRNFACPVCRQDEYLLNAALIQTITGAILLTFRSNYIRVACASCLNKATLQAMLITLVSGWWSQSGLLRTPGILIDLFKTWRANNKAEPSGAFRKFVLMHIDFIQQYKQQPEQLFSLIQQKTIL